MLAKLKGVLSDERNKRAIHKEIKRRTRKAEVQIGRIETQMEELRTKIERATGNLALGDRADIPGITRLLAGWREQEGKLNDQLRRARGDEAPSPEALEVIVRLENLQDRLTEADREKLAFAIRQTVKRITLRRDRRRSDRHRATILDGVIELRDDLGISGAIPLIDDDVPTPGRWRDVAVFVREHSGAVYRGDVADTLGIHRANASQRLAQAVLAGKIINLVHQKGWTAIK